MPSTVFFYCSLFPSFLPYIYFYFSRLSHLTRGQFSIYPTATCHICPCNMSQYIGKTISLISTKGVRYVGILKEINAENSTVALGSMRSFGTEGRAALEGGQEIPPSSDTYEYVVFRGSDVKDLSVLDTPLDQLQPTPTPTSTLTLTEPPSVASRAPPSDVSIPAKQTPTQNTSEPTPSQSQHNAQPVTAPEPKNITPAKKLAQPAQPQPRDGPSTTSNRQRPQEIEGDFDFESANAKFTRDEEKLSITEAPVYNKSTSFFDSLSTTSERSGMRWSEEKTLNYDTFGQTSTGRGRGGFRGRGNRGGRGGRGNFRGRGRGKPEPKPEWA